MGSPISGPRCVAHHPVSYTHLDVYKRQAAGHGDLSSAAVRADDGQRVAALRWANLFKKSPHRTALNLTVDPNLRDES